jgi:Transposase DDE domain group 1
VLATLAGKLTGRRQDCAPLAVKSTLNRLEHAPTEPSRYQKIGHHAAAIEGLLVDLLLDAHRTPPKEIILDLEATDDPLHGHQEGRFFNGYSWATSRLSQPYCRITGTILCNRNML